MKIDSFELLLTTWFHQDNLIIMAPFMLDVLDVLIS